MENEVVLSSETKVLIPSKENAKSFYKAIRDRIFETGEGLWEFLEFLKFIEKVQEQIKGTYDPITGYGSPPDEEFREYVRSEIEKYEKSKFISPRGVKFELMEAGTRYDYTKCGDPIYNELIKRLEVLKAEVKEREGFLKGVPDSGITVLDNETGEVVTVYSPTKTSTSTYKITLPK